MLLNIIVFIFILGLLIFVHELGHFLAAKKAGVKVEEFAFGFPPRVFSRKYKETEYSINLIPLGGYVKMLGEEEDINKPGSFHAQKPLKRLGIIVAGVAMNFVLAIVLMTIGFMIGMTPLVSDPAGLPGQKDSRVMILEVRPDSPASRADLQKGNILEGFSSAEQLQKFTSENAGQKVNLKVTRQGQTQEIAVELGQNDQGPLGVGVISVTKVKQNFFDAFVTSIKETIKVVGLLFVLLWSIISSLFSSGTVGEAGQSIVGPVGLFNFTAEAIRIGWIYVLQLIIILSINLGVVNILPFPALDGGKVLFIALEGMFKRKVVRQEVENFLHMIGFALLILLLIVITYRDIFR